MLKQAWHFSRLSLYLYANIRYLLEMECDLFDFLRLPVTRGKKREVIKTEG